LAQTGSKISGQAVAVPERVCPLMVTSMAVIATSATVGVPTTEVATIEPSESEVTTSSVPYSAFSLVLTVSMMPCLSSSEVVVKSASKVAVTATFGSSDEVGDATVGLRVGLRVGTAAGSAVVGAVIGDGLGAGLSMMAKVGLKEGGTEVVKFGLKEGGTEVVGTEVAGLEEEVGASAHWHLGQPSPHVYVYR